jgi:hypothetical protein
MFRRALWFIVALAMLMGGLYAAFEQLFGGAGTSRRALTAAAVVTIAGASVLWVGFVRPGLGWKVQDPQS